MCFAYHYIHQLSLQDHEQSLIDVLSRLADASDGESGKYI